MLLGALFVFILSRSLAHPLSSPTEDLVSPTSPILNTFAAISDCIRDPRKIRSTPELVWNCLGTIFVCTYAAIHPNMPDRNASKRRRMWQKAKTSLYALLAPEVIIVFAMRQRVFASKIARQYRDRGWTLTHGFFVIMGGLMREDGDGFKVVTIDGYGNVSVGEEERRGVLFPTIPEEEITDKAKGDFLTKVVVVLQTSWFVIQCIARHAQGLVVTELELVTLAFATLNVITYFLWWSKPLNAEYPIYFRKDGRRTSGPLQIEKNSIVTSEWYLGLWIGWTWKQLEKPKKSIWQRIQSDMEQMPLSKVLLRWLLLKPFRAIFKPLDDMLQEDSIRHPGYVSPYYSGKLPYGEWIAVVSLSTIIGVLFEGIHLIGWNFPFSTRIERDLWRMSSVVVTLEPVVLTSGFIVGWLGPKYPMLVRVFILPKGSVGSLLGLLYIPARIALLVLPLVGLRNLPPSAFQNVQWSNYIPHI
ncbi:hypothetical protein AX16_007835 [Volvariella volvacea WC 439]|nr:hypothetical protein AX16_007835 [Volvariella volvacea WC 439]